MLACSYIGYGGTNGTLAGGSNMAEKARDGTPDELDERYGNAAKLSAAWGVYLCNVKETKRSLEERKRQLGIHSQGSSLLRKLRGKREKPPPVTTLLQTIPETSLTYQYWSEMPIIAEEHERLENFENGEPLLSAHLHIRLEDRTNFIASILSVGTDLGDEAVTEFVRRYSISHRYLLENIVKGCMSISSAKVFDAQWKQPKLSQVLHKLVDTALALKEVSMSNSEDILAEFFEDTAQGCTVLLKESPRLYPKEVSAEESRDQKTNIVKRSHQVEENYTPRRIKASENRKASDNGCPPKSKKMRT